VRKQEGVQTEWCKHTRNTRSGRRGVNKRARQASRRDVALFLTNQERDRLEEQRRQRFIDEQHELDAEYDW